MNTLNKKSAAFIFTAPAVLIYTVIVILPILISVAFLLPHPASMDTAIDITKNNEAHFFNFLLTISFPPLFYT